MLPEVHQKPDSDPFRFEHRRTFFGRGRSTVVDASSLTQQRINDDSAFQATPNSPSVPK
jgi:hypothetical protein